MTPSKGRMGGVVLALGLLLLATVAPAVQAAASACTLSVTPASGPPGTQFVFSGQGYTPTTLTLTRDGKPPRTLPLNLGGADPFTIPFVAADGDVGRWKVVASVEGSSCAGTAAIKVTLPSTSTSTSTLDAAAPPVAANQAPGIAAFAGLAVLFLVSTLMVFRGSRIRTLR